MTISAITPSITAPASPYAPTESELEALSLAADQLSDVVDRRALLSLRTRLLDEARRRDAQQFLPNPSDADLTSPEFNALWSVLKGWELRTANPKSAYPMYAGANGSHVMVLLNALRDAGLTVLPASQR